MSDELLETEELDETFMVETELNPAPEDALPDDDVPVWMTQGRKGPVREASPVESLLLKLDMWLLQQPEFLFVITTADRKVRREASRLIAKHITTYPMRGRSFGGL